MPTFLSLRERGIAPFLERRIPQAGTSSSLPSPLYTAGPGTINSSPSASSPSAASTIPSVGLLPKYQAAIAGVVSLVGILLLMLLLCRCFSKRCHNSGPRELHSIEAWNTDLEDSKTFEEPRVVLSLNSLPPSPTPWIHEPAPAWVPQVPVRTHMQPIGGDTGKVPKPPKRWRASSRLFVMQAVGSDLPSPNLQTPPPTYSRDAFNIPQYGFLEEKG